MQDIERRIPVPIHHLPAVRAGMDALAQLLLDQFAAERAQLGCVARVDQDDGSASFCRFADRHADKLVPRHVHNTLAQRAPFTRAHLLRRKVFKHNHLIGSDQFPALLVGKVATPTGDPLVDFCQQFFLQLVLCPVLRVFCRVLALLDTFQVSLIPAVEARIVDPLTSRERGKGHKTHIHADNAFSWRQGMRLGLARETGVPFARRGAVEGDGLGRSLDWTVQDDLDRANLTDNQPLTFKAYPIAVLWIGHAIVAPEWLEARVARLVSPVLDALKERLERQVNPHLDVLQDLAMYQFERGARLFPEWQQRLCVIQPKRDAFGIGITARGKGLVIDKAAFLKLLLKDTPLAAREIDAVFEGFSHILSVLHIYVKSKYVRLWAQVAQAWRFIPPLMED